MSEAEWKHLHIVDALQEVGDLGLASFRVASATVRQGPRHVEGTHLAFAEAAVLVAIDQSLDPTPPGKRTVSPSSVIKRRSSAAALSSETLTFRPWRVPAFLFLLYNYKR